MLDFEIKQQIDGRFFFIIDGERSRFTYLEKHHAEREAISLAWSKLKTTIQGS